MSANPTPEAVRDARQIIDEFIQCAEAGRPHGKLIAQARDWLALTAAQQQGQAVAWRLWRTNAVTGEWMPCTREWNDGAPEPGIAESLNNRVSQHRVEVAYAAPPPSVPDGWKLVPVEPTEAMLDAAMQREDDEPLSDWGKVMAAPHEAIYAAMIAAAPALAQQPAAESLADTQRAIIEAAERRGYERARSEQPAANPFVGVVCPECNAEYEATARQPAAVAVDAGLAESLRHAANRWEREAEHHASGFADEYSSGQRHAYKSCALEMLAILDQPLATQHQDQTT